MNYIVLDLEWNQPLSADRTIRKPVSLHGEIIQIGAVMLDENFGVSETCKLMIKPKFYTRMHWSVSKLTRIKNIDLTCGLDFPTAMGCFREWCGKEFVWMTWGPDDIGILRDNLLLHHMETNWLPPCFDLQMLYDLQIGHTNGQVALETAMEQLHEPILESHDALNDALNTAKICSYLHLEEAVSDYAAMQREYLRRIAGADSVFCPEHPYDNLTDALEDAEFMQFECPFCQKSGICSGMVKQGGGKYIGFGKCQNEHEFLVRVKFSRRRDKKTDAIRFLYRMTDELLAYYLEKKEKAERKHQMYLAKKSHRTKKRTNPRITKKKVSL